MQMIAACREPDRIRGPALMVKLIESLSHGVPAALSELITLRRTLKQPGDDVLAYYDRPADSVAGCAVDLLPEDVGVPDVPGVLPDDVHVDPPQ